jgi:hypothetical protein
MSTSVVTKRVKWQDMHDLPDNPIMLTRLERIERDGGFKIGSVGTPELALNDERAFPDLEEDALILIDGHHRRKLWERANGNRGPDDVICKIHRGLTREEIEQRFLDANDYRHHHVNELFVHRVASGEVKARAINRIITDAGFHVPPNAASEKNAIRGVNAVEWVYDGGKRAGSQVYPIALTRTLEGLRLMYGADKDVTKSNLVKGLGLFHLRYGKAIDLDRLHKNLPAKHRTVAQLLADAGVFQEALKYQVPQAVAYTVRLAYNGKRRSKHDLPEWR